MSVLSIVTSVVKSVKSRVKAPAVEAPKETKPVAVAKVPHHVDLNAAKMTRKLLRRTVTETLDIDVVGQSVEAQPKEFSTGSFGWHMNGKVTIMVDGQPLRCQISGCITIIGSKELPEVE